MCLMSKTALVADQARCWLAGEQVDTRQCLVFLPCTCSKVVGTRGEIIEEIFAHDFRQVRSKSGNLEKYRQARSQSVGDDQLRRRQGWIHGTQPTAKTAPDLCCVIDRKVL